MDKPHFSAARNIDLGDYLDEKVYPELFKRLDTAFPEFGWRPNGKGWSATQWPQGFPLIVGDSRPDRLMVYADRPWWCKVHGHDGVRFLDYVNGGHRPSGPEFIEAVRILCEKSGVAFPERERSPEEQERLRRQENRRSALAVVIEHLQETLWDSQEDSQQALAYLLSRGFTEEEVKQLGLGYYRSVQEVRQRLRAAGYNDQNPEDRQALEDSAILWDQLEGYIFIPWNDATGHPLTLYGRWREKDPPEGRPKTTALPGADTKSSPLYFDRARQAGHRDLVAVEGVFDAALLQVRGDTRVVGYVAAQFSGLQVETLKRYQIASVVVAPDPDGGGAKGALGSVKSLWEHGITPYVTQRLPEELDPDEFLLKHGLDGWKAHVSQAIPGLVYMAQSLLGAVTPETPSYETEKAIREVAKEMRGLLQGKDKERYRNQVLREITTQTGWTSKELAPLFFPPTQKDRLPSHAPEQPDDTLRPSPGVIGATAESKPGKPFHRTDMGNAQRLVQRHGRDLRYCHAWRKWLVWNGARWEEDRTEEVLRRARDTVVSLYREAAAIRDDEERKQAVKWALQSENEPRLRAMVSLSESEPGVPIRPEDLDRDPFLLNCRSGTLDLRTGALREHRRGDLLTKLCPVDYDPAAECPTWQAFINRIMDGNEPLIRFLQHAIGYSLSGDTSEQCIFILHGVGANGKTSLLNCIREACGDYAQQTPCDTFMVKRGETHPTDVAGLMGVRLACAVEVEEGRRMAESLVKQATGGEPLRARFMRCDFFEYLPNFKLWLGTNHKPNIRGTDWAIWRRIQLIPFNVVIPEPERDKRLPEKLRAEWPGILAWAVRGCLAWQRDGLGSPQEVRAATAAYRAEMDVLAGFLGDCCIVNADAKASAKDLYRTYGEWCEANGERAEPQRRFGERLTERGFERYKVRGLSWWRGIGLAIQVDDVDDGRPKNSITDKEPVSRSAILKIGLPSSTSSTTPNGSADLLALAASLGWPRLDLPLALWPGRIVWATEPAWQDFIKKASSAALAAAEAQLRERQTRAEAAPYAAF